MSTHTPGPWQTEAHGTDLSVCPKTADENGFYIIAHMRGPNQNANARLIEAAPELAEAVRELLATHPAAYREPGKIDNRTDNAIKIARAAIAKVEGGTA